MWTKKVLYVQYWLYEINTIAVIVKLLMICRQMTWKNRIFYGEKKISYETQTVRKTLKGDSKQKRTLYIRPVLGGGGSEGQSWNVLESCVYVGTLIHLMTPDS